MTDLPPLTIHIRSIDPSIGRLSFNELPRSTTVGDIKRMISDQHPERAPQSSQKLIFMGRVLLDDSNSMQEIVPGRLPEITINLVVSRSDTTQNHQPQSPIIPPTTPRPVQRPTGPTPPISYPQGVPPEVVNYLTQVRDCLAAKHEEAVGRRFIFSRRPVQSMECSIPQNYVQFLPHIGPSTGPEPVVRPRIRREALQFLVGGLLFFVFVTGTIGINKALLMLVLAGVASLAVLLLRNIGARIPARLEGRRPRPVNIFLRNFFLFVQSLLPGFRLERLLLGNHRQERPNEEEQQEHEAPQEPLHQVAEQVDQSVEHDLSRQRDLPRDVQEDDPHHDVQG
ncbi:hypothetical protein P9112_014706 [Eukaryota sp. TZLM1-RC]